MAGGMVMNNSSCHFWFVEIIGSQLFILTTNFTNSCKQAAEPSDTNLAAPKVRLNGFAVKKSCFTAF
jgi:hypothetical protein